MIYAIYILIYICIDIYIYIYIYIWIITGTLAAVMGHHHYLYAIEWHTNNWKDFDPMIPAKEAYEFYQKQLLNSSSSY